MQKRTDRNARLLVLAALGVLALRAGIAAGAEPKEWEGQLLKPVEREEVYKFTKKPSVRKVGRDRYEISFASKGRCDVAVAVEDARGRIVRHLVYGVLGSNAPAPFKRDSLEQTLVWNGKDDRGEYVDAPETCRVRVSLGLDPTFDKLVGWHPKDTVASREIGGIAATRDGVYVLDVSSRNQVRMYNHDGNYLRTLWPLPGDKVNTKAVDIPTRTIEFNGRIVPFTADLGGIQPFTKVVTSSSMAAAGGKIAIAQGGRDDRWILRLRNDGTTGGEPITGALLHKAFSPKSGHIKSHMAMSPDGRYLYMTSLSTCHTGRTLQRRGGPFYWNAVWRIPWGRTGEKAVLTENAFIGEVGRDDKAGTGAGKDERHLDMPEGLACDAQGRLYVCDSGNNRVQVFSTEGKHVKTIPVKQPQEIAVHQKTGEIYVLCFARGRGRISRGFMTLCKFGPVKNPKKLIERKFALPGGDGRVTGFVPVLCVDSWAKPAKVWLLPRRGEIQIWADRGEAFELVDDFRKDVIAAGLRPAMLGAYKMNRVEADPVRGHLYYLRTFGLLRCDDPDGPGKFTRIDLPGSTKMFPMDIDISNDGLLYARALQFIARFDPDKARVGKDLITFPYESEVPFDYGEGQKLSFATKGLRGAIVVAALPGANGFDTGTSVAPNGDVISFMTTYRDKEGFMGGRPSTYYDGNQLRKVLQQMADRAFRPHIFPGRYTGGAEIVMRWSERGELIGEDLVPAVPLPSCGIKTDAAGNIYMGMGARWMMPDGKPHRGGTVAKFPPRGGKVYGKGDLVQLEELPERPHEFLGPRIGPLWAKNMYWTYPGLDLIHGLGTASVCLCSTSRFDTDLYGRSFVPKAYQFTVGVVDTNGNRICEIGRYGNADTRGPRDSTVRIGAPEIAIAHCSFVGVDSDRWLYIQDDGNARVIRVKLGYRAEERVPLQ